MSNGSVWVTGDVITAVRMNLKTILVDTGSAINSASATEGQLAYCNSTGSVFSQGIIYQYNGTAWAIFGGNVPTVLLNSLFSQFTSNQTWADAVWITSDTSKIRVNVTNKNMDFDLVLDNTNTAMYNILPSILSNAIWCVRFSLNFSTLTMSANNYMFLVLSSNKVNSYAGSTQNYIGFALAYTAGTQKYYAIYGNNVNINYATFDSGKAFTPVTATPYYFEIQRISPTTIQVNRYTDSTYTSIADQSAVITIPEAIVNLQYFKLQKTQITETGVFQGTMDNIKVLNYGTTFP